MALSLYKLAFPGIVALLAVGTAGFLLAFSYYPEKHVNVDIDGKCYELLGISNEKHKILRAENEINVKQMQLNMIEHSDTSLPIVFSGFKGDVDDFINPYDIRNILSVQKVSDNPTFDKFIIKATLAKNELQQIGNDLTISLLLLHFIERFPNSWLKFFIYIFPYSRRYLQFRKSLS